MPHRVVIVGGGFAGLQAAKGLNDPAFEVTLVDRRNFHLFQPLLYQVATGGLSPANIAAPLRWVLRKQKNARVLLGEVRGVDPVAQHVHLDDAVLAYDSLIVATGARHHYFGNAAWEAHAPGLKTIEDATAIRARILGAFERAERQGPDTPQLTLMVVGAGPTGVEMAGAIAEIAQVTLKEDFRSIDSTQAKVVLVEGGPRVLPSYPPDLSTSAEGALHRLGVTVRTGIQVVGVDDGGVDLKTANGPERVEGCTVIWAAGVQASPLGERIATACGAEVDRAGRVIVNADLTAGSRDNVFVLGDLAHFAHQGEATLPGVAPVAMQQGRYVAKLLRRRLSGKGADAFRYLDKGNMATIGRAAAVVDAGWMRMTGFPAWMTWLLIHLMYLVGYSNRALVLFQWGWNYLTRGRTARLITHPPQQEPD